MSSGQTPWLVHDSGMVEMLENLANFEMLVEMLENLENL
jgi:hypothetical protein